MQVNPRVRFFGLLLVFLALIGAAGYVSWSIYFKDQAAKDSSAGGGGGGCCHAESGCGTELPCCRTAGWIQDTRDGIGCMYAPDQATICGTPASYYIGLWGGSSVTCSSGTGASCPNPSDDTVAVCYYGDAITGKCINVPTNRCVFFDDNAGIYCDCGCPSKESVCSGKTGTQTSTCTRCGNPVTYNCGGTDTGGGGTDNGGGGTDNGGGGGGGGGQTPACPYGSTQARFKPNNDSLPWEGIESSTVQYTCDTGFTGQYVFGGFHDGNATSYPSDIKLHITGPGLNQDLTQGQTLYINKVGDYTVTAVTNGHETDAGCFGSATFRCNPYNVTTTEVCGDAVCSQGEQCERTSANGSEARMCLQNGSAPTGAVVSDCTFTGSNTCQTGGVAAGVQGVTVTKAATGVCAESGGYNINYTITVTNISDVTATYADITDLLDSRLSNPAVTAISNGGNLVGNTINWPAGTLAVGQSQTFTYSLALDASNVTNFDSVANTVTVDYGPTNDIQQVSYTYEQPLQCDENGVLVLPETGFKEFRLIYLGVIFIGMAIIIYQLKFGSQGIELALLSIKNTFNDILPERRKAKAKGKFERKVLKKD